MREIHGTAPVPLLIQNSGDVPCNKRSKLRKTKKIRKVYARREKNSRREEKFYAEPKRSKVPQLGDYRRQLRPQPSNSRRIASAAFEGKMLSVSAKAAHHLTINHFGTEKYNSGDSTHHVLKFS